jgi:hypothetical protein
MTSYESCQLSRAPARAPATSYRDGGLCGALSVERCQSVERGVVDTPHPCGSRACVPCAWRSRAVTWQVSALLAAAEQYRKGSGGQPSAGSNAILGMSGLGTTQYSGGLAQVRLCRAAAPPPPPPPGGGGGGGGGGVPRQQEPAARQRAQPLYSL